MEWTNTDEISEQDIESLVEEKEDNKYEEWLLSEYDKQFNM